MISFREVIFENLMKTCMYSSKLRGLQKTFEIHCQPLHVTEEMFYFETRCDYHPLASCIMYTIFQAGDEGYGSQIANSLVKLVDVTWKGKDLGLNYVSLVPIVELLLVNNQEIWSVFESLGMLSIFYLLGVYYMHSLQSCSAPSKLNVNHYFCSVRCSLVEGNPTK